MEPPQGAEGEGGEWVGDLAGKAFFGGVGGVGGGGGRRRSGWTGPGGPCANTWSAVSGEGGWGMGVQSPPRPMGTTAYGEEGKGSEWRSASRRRHLQKSTQHHGVMPPPPPPPPWTPAAPHTTISWKMDPLVFHTPRCFTN